MNERVTSEERRQSPSEEVANAVSAGAGLIAAIAGIPLLFAFGTQRGGDWTVAGAAVFAATTVWLYLTSTVYHVLWRTRAKRRFRLFDHMGIFLLIAGTYTPFTLGMEGKQQIPERGNASPPSLIFTAAVSPPSQESSSWSLSSACESSSRIVRSTSVMSVANQHFEAIWAR